MHETGGQEMRHVELAGLGQDPVLVILYRRIGKWASHIAPIRQQFVQRLRVNHSTRKDMRADFGSLFKDADARVGRLLFYADRRRKSCWPSANNNNIIGHRLAFTHCLYPLPGILFRPS